MIFDYSFIADTSSEEDEEDIAAIVKRKRVALEREEFLKVP